MPPSHHVPHQDYMGLALKQWSVYLGNVLLNFIHKECKNGSNSVQCSAREQHINNFMNQQISKHQQHQISNNHNNRTTNAGNGNSERFVEDFVNFRIKNHFNLKSFFHTTIL